MKNIIDIINPVNNFHSREKNIDILLSNRYIVLKPADSYSTL